VSAPLDIWRLGSANRERKKLGRAAAGLQAGVDLNSGSVFTQLAPAVRAGIVSESRVDTALRRLMQARVRLGTLNPARADPFARIPASVLNSAAHRAVALEAARSSLVLLQNRGEMLPLPVDRWSRAGAQVLVVGPAANDTFRMVGSYNYHGCRRVDPDTGRPVGPELEPQCGVQSPLEGLRQILHQRAGDRVRAVFSPGADQAGNATRARGAIAEAVRIAKDSDAVVAFVGLSNTRGCHSSGNTSLTRCEGEGRDRDDLQLPKVQRELLDALLDTGKPIIVVLSTGSAVALPLNQAARPNCSILVAWYGGRMGAQAVAEALLGVVAPAGRLPITFYTNTSQLPSCSDSPSSSSCSSSSMYDLTAGPGRTNQYFTGTPLFAFGFGLSYASFRYANATVEPRHIESPDTQSIRVCVTVTNNGPFKLPADETAMVFARYDGNHTTRARPLQQLVGFLKVRRMTTGQTRNVCIECPTTAMHLVGADFGPLPRLLPGPYSLFVGGRAPGTPGLLVDTDYVQKSRPIQIQITVAAAATNQPLGYHETREE